MTASFSGRTEGLPPLDTLYDGSEGEDLPLPSELARFYGGLKFPLEKGKPYVIANLVTSLDGIVSLGIPGKAGGKEISGSNEQDRALMGLLRAAAGAVVVGASTLREGNGSPITAAGVYPPLASGYAALAASLGKEREPLAVVVSASGDLDPSMRVFQTGTNALVVTTGEGMRRARQTGLADVARVVEAKGGSGGPEGSIAAGAVLYAVRTVQECAIVLVEGGPHVLGDFLSEGLIDEQFLTLSPQVVGRDSSGKRLGLVEGKTFAPDEPLWARLSVVKRGENHLFLRYFFGNATAPEAKQ